MKQSDAIVFCQEIWDWFAAHKRTLPWRDLKVKDINQKAYLVLVSEIMLQQTQVPRVIILYKQFIQKFPHIEALSKASNREILIAWRGLGYNNRALRLRDAAKTIVEKFDGEFPSDMDSLQSISGIGHYTAGALRNFAFGIPTPCIDTNIRRILHRFFIGPENADGTWKKNDKYLLNLAKEVLEIALAGEVRGVGEVGTAEWHAALMDFGSLVCTKNNPKWELLSPSLRSVCKSYGKNIVTKKSEKKEPGRMMAGRYIPNRIFRGKIIEALRDAQEALKLEEVGKRAIADWSMGDHKKWLSGLIEGLKRDRLVQESAAGFSLAA